MLASHSVPCAPLRTLFSVADRLCCAGTVCLCLRRTRGCVYDELQRHGHGSAPIVVSPSEESDIIGMQSRVVDACCCGKVGHIFPFALRPALPVTICARCVQMSESLQGGMCSMRQRAPPKRKRKIAGGAGGGYIEGGPSPPDGPRSSIRKRIYLTYRLSLKSLP